MRNNERYLAFSPAVSQAFLEVSDLRKIWAKYCSIFTNKKTLLGNIYSIKKYTHQKGSYLHGMSEFQMPISPSKMQFGSQF